MTKLLIVEDDHSVAQLLQFALESERYVIDHCTHCADALAALRTNDYDMLILDWALPDGSGIDLCKQYRATGGNKPILMLTARESSRDKVTGLTAGADDYVVKPFDPDELIARTKALLRRPPLIAESTLCVGDVTLDTASFTVKIGNYSAQLVPKEYAILHLLMEHPGRFFTAESILARVWRSDLPVSTDSVRTHIKTLRKKFIEADSRIVIENSRGLGYRIKSQ
ncbi:MAG: response regulator transcription factor [Cyanobacteria bacterium SZAS LIN-3]|nr:response regulator transcription factor [Cyanobacteria bacterium SZAS LIN-3]MBS2005723.1 response regulator transcription factor [Cyanobacteria bacterium SZAS TMP-1]